MNSNFFCPISIVKIDEKVARLNGGLTVILLVVSYLLNTLVPVFFLAADFFLRGASLSKYSPLALFSKFILKSLNSKPQPINAGPKIFAARIGFVFSLSVIVLSLFGLESAAWVVGGVFGICAFLESSIGYCVACKIYPLVYKIFQSTELKKIRKFGFQDFEI